MYRRSVTFVVLISLISCSAACSSMRYISLREMSAVKQKPTVWVTMTDGTRYEIKNPKVMGSKLVGYVQPDGYREIDASEIERLGVRELDPAKTAAVGVFGIAAVIVFVTLVSQGDGNDGSCST